MSAALKLTGRYRELQAAARKGDDVSETLERLDDALDVTAERLVGIVRGLEAEQAKLDADAKALAEQKRKLARAQEQMESYLTRRLVNLGTSSVKCPGFTVFLKEAERVVVDDEKAIPPPYMRTKTTTEPNKVLILEAHRNRRETVPGTHVEQVVSLQVK